MKISKEVIKYIKDEPRFRERKNKNRGLANILLRLHPIIKDVKPEIFAYIIGEVLTMDRTWRKFLAENPDYRGKDYGDRERLMEKAMVELGYK